MRRLLTNCCLFSKIEYYKMTSQCNSYGDQTFWYKQCNCCPYGYHIDLDFIQYCDSLGQVHHTASMKRRKDRRRQRQSMLVLLGLDALSAHQNSYKAQLADLKEEKCKLLLQLKLNKNENLSINKHLHAQLTSTSDFQKNMSPHKDIGVTCTLLAPTTNLDTQYINTLESKLVGFSNKFYQEKCTINDQNISECNTLIDKRTSDTTMVSKETQTTLPRNRKDSSIQTMHNKQMLNSTRKSKKSHQSAGVSAYVNTTETSTEPLITPGCTIGLSEDSIDVLLCNACTCSNFDDTKRSIFYDQFHLKGLGHTIDSQYNLSSEHKSIECEAIAIDNYNNCKIHNNKMVNIDVSTNTDLIGDVIFSLHKLQKQKMTLVNSVGCQFEYSCLHKACQVNFKVKDKAIQCNETLQESVCDVCFQCTSNRNELTTHTPTNIALSSLMVPRTKSSSFATSTTRSIGCQYNEVLYDQKSTQAMIEMEDKIVQYEKMFYFTKFETKMLFTSTLSDSERSVGITSENDNKYNGKDDNIEVTSRIPRLQSAPENRKLNRQDTYNIDLSKSGCTPDKQLKNDSEASAVPESDGIGVIQNNMSADFSLYSDIHHDKSIQRQKTKPSKSMRAALKVLSDCLKKGQTENLEDQLKNSINIVQLEWFKISNLIDANPLDVEDYLDFFENMSFDLLHYIVNMVDANGNTAMHYAVSHGNFDVVSILLDSKICDINQANKAGYTCVMLVSLVDIPSLEHSNVIRRLFNLADVNVKAKQHGQTALMLAVSHGRLDMVQMLLEASADINIQDEDGSTALMCASEHGHIELVKLFLDQPECDSTIADVDGSTALTIAMEAGHRPIGVLLYTHQRIHKASIQSSKLS